MGSDIDGQEKSKRDEAAAPEIPIPSADVRHHLAEIAGSASFRASYRSQEFLTYIVEQALEGHTDTLKERIIGQDVFHRPDYEPASDTAVRVAASDLRRKLAHFYEEHPESPIRIELPLGSYVPEFRSGHQALEPLSGLTEAQRLSRRRFRYGVAVVGLALLATVMAVLLGGRNVGDDREMAAFWRPVLGDREPILFCLGGGTRIWLSDRVRNAFEQQSPSVVAGPKDYVMLLEDQISSGNLRAVFSIATYLERRGQTTQVRWPSEIQAAELHRRKMIFFGTFSNPWTMETARDLRFALEATGECWVVRDRKTNESKWTLSELHPLRMTRDLAIITRIIDASSGRVLIFVGGVQAYGTEAAGEFLTDAAAWRELARNAPKGWDRMNLQVVLETTVLYKKPSRTKVLATYFW